MPTVREFLKSALVKSGVVGLDQTSVSDAYLTMALTELNEIIDNYNIKGDFPPHQKEEEFTVSTLKKIYTIGPSGDMNTLRPVDIIGMKYKQSDYWYPIPRLANQNFNDTIENINNSGLPTWFRYLQEYPLGKIEFNQIPSDTDTFRVISNKFAGPFTLDEEMINVAGVQIALKYRLASNIAQQLGNEVMYQSLNMKADKYLEDYTNSHSETPELECSFATGRYDYESDGFR